MAVVSECECGVLDTLTVGDDISQVLIKFLNPLSTHILEISDSKVYFPTEGREAMVGWRGGASEAEISLRLSLADFTDSAHLNHLNHLNRILRLINLLQFREFVVFLTN